MQELLRSGKASEILAGSVAAEEADLVEQLALRGVQFDVCEITLRNRKLTKDQFIEYATFVPSGVVKVRRLQQREGYAYLKP